MCDDLVFETFIGNPEDINYTIYRLWLEGYNEEEAKQRFTQLGLTQFDLGEDTLPGEVQRLKSCVYRDVNDQYRLYAIYLPHLKDPQRCSSGVSTLPLSSEDHNMLVELYYSFDDKFMRHLVGARLSKRLRNSLDSISDTLNIPVLSCERQFNNCKAVYRGMMNEDIKEREEMGVASCDNELFVVKLNRLYAFSDELAKKYTHVVFMIRYKFDTLEKQLAMLSYNDFDEFAETLLSHWTNASDRRRYDLDVAFIEELKSLRQQIMDKRLVDEYGAVLKSALADSIEPKTLSRLMTKFRSTLKGLNNVATRLTKDGDLRDLFVDLLEEVVIPLHRLSLSNDEAKLFFSALKTCFAEHKQFDEIHSSEIWIRYLSAVSGICTTLFARSKNKKSDRFFD